MRRFFSRSAGHCTVPAQPPWALGKVAVAWRQAVVVCLAAGALVGCSQQAATPTLEAAQQALKEGRVGEALNATKQILSEDPSQALARLLLGKVLLSVGDSAGAELEIRKALQGGLNPDEVRPHLMQAMLDGGRVKPLIEEFKSAQTSDPKAWVDMTSQLAEAYARSGDRPTAERLLKEVETKDANAVSLKLVRGRLLAAAGDRDQALALAKAATVQADSNPLAWRLLGDIQLYLQSDPDAAAASYKRLVALSPERVDGHTALITARMFQKDDAAAAEAVAALAKMAPGHPQTKLFQAVLAQRRNDHKQARDLAQQVLKLLPNSTVALQLAGGSMIELGEFSQAEALLSKAVYVAPKSAGARLLLARAHLRQGRAARAMETLRPLLQQPSPDVEVLLMAAEARLQEGQTGEAEQLFAAAKKARPADQRPALALARMRLSKGDSTTAMEELRRLAESGQDGQAEQALFSVYMRQGDSARAVAVAQELANKQPKQALPHVLKARALRLAKNPQEARASLERALELEPSFFPALSALALIDLADKKPDAAVKRLQAATERDPANEQAWIALAGLMSSLPDRKAEVTALLQKAIQASPQSAPLRGLLVNHQLQSRDRQAALVTAQAAVAALPQSADAHVSLGKVLVATGDHLQAQKAFSTASSLQPGSAAVVLHIADAARLAGDAAGAMSAVRRAAELEPASPLVAGALLSVASGTRAYEPALAIVQDLKRKRPDDAGPHLLEGELRLLQKQTDAALLAYRGGLAKRNASALAVRLHALLLQNKRAAEAQQFASEWLQRAPRDAVFQSHLADVAQHAGDLVAAENLYRKARAMDERYPPAANGLAWAMVQNRRPGAVDEARRALALAPDRPEPLDTYAMAQLRAGDVDNALGAWRELLARWPDASYAQLHLATALVDSKRERDEARRLLEALVAANHPASLKAAAKAQLARLGA